MKAVAKQRALKLRLETGLSYTQIAKEVGVSRSTLSLWLRDFPLCPERVQFLKKEGWERGEKKRELYREAMKKKRKDREKAVYEARLADFVHLSPQAIFTAGLTLYEAEGDKKSDSAIAFTNTDPELIRFFMLWLERFLCVPQELLRFQLRLYEGMDIAAEEHFWTQILGIHPAQLWKSQVRALRPNSFTYRDTSRHGTCKLHFGSVAKKLELRLSIRAFFDTYNKHLRA